MLELLASGRLVELALSFMVLEAAALAAFHWFTGRGLSVFDVLGHLSAGAFLMLALRSALVGDPPAWTAAFLGASLPAHLLDLGRRWRRSGRVAYRAR